MFALSFKTNIKKPFLAWLILLLVAACNNNPHPKILNEQNYSLEYDEDWYLDNYDEEFDPDYYFLISSREQDAFVSMFFYDGPVDAEALLQEKLKQHIGHTISGASQQPMDSWGNYKGKGMELEGKLLGTEKAVLTLFVYSGKQTSFLVVTQVLSADKEKYKNSINLVKNSFKLKE